MNASKECQSIRRTMRFGLQCVDISVFVLDVEAMELFEGVRIDFSCIEPGFQGIIAFFDQILEVIIRSEHVTKIGSIA